MFDENVGHVGQWAKLYRLKTSADAILVRIEGMKLANEKRRGEGLSPAYGEDSFLELEKELEWITENFLDI